MLKNPCIVMNREKLKHNTQCITRQCRKLGISVAGVTKSFCADTRLARAMIDGGITELADSRLENLIAMENLLLPKMLLRLPQISELAEVVHYSDISLNSEWATIARLSDIALGQNKVHKIILMVDLGDLREGVWPDHVPNLVRKILPLAGVELIGIGTNLTCFGGILPTVENLSLLVDLAEQIRCDFSIELPLVSGGNSSSLYLVYNAMIPEGINHLRIGKAITLGREAAFGKRLEGLYDDVFTCYGEVIEVGEKPSLPIGISGVNTFGEKPVFLDKGKRKRAIVAMGRQDINIQSLLTMEAGTEVVGASSDHLIVDINDCCRQYAVGDVIGFKLQYAALLAGMTSQYVKKVLA